MDSDEYRVAKRLVQVVGPQTCAAVSLSWRRMHELGNGEKLIAEVLATPEPAPEPQPVTDVSVFQAAEPMPEDEWRAFHAAVTSGCSCCDPAVRERVARALWDARGGDTPWEKASGSGLRDHYLHLADVAIEARENADG